MAQQGDRINQIIYVDGFAEPGEHDNGEKGSPLIAYETAVYHHLEHNFQAEIVLIFVEAKQERAKNLKECLNAAQMAKKSDKGNISYFNNFNAQYY